MVSFFKKFTLTGDVFRVEDATQLAMPRHFFLTRQPRRCFSPEKKELGDKMNGSCVSDGNKKVAGIDSSRRKKNDRDWLLLISSSCTTTSSVRVSSSGLIVTILAQWRITESTNRTVLITQRCCSFSFFSLSLGGR